MWLTQLCKRWFGTPRAARRCRLRATLPRHNTRLMLERLEDRIVPAGPTIRVANGDVAGLIAAINTANSDGQPTTISLAANGDYVLTQVNNATAYGPGANGLPQITGNVTIEGNGATLERGSASGTPAFRLLDLFNGSLTLDNLTIKGGEESGYTWGSQQLPSGASLQGGGIFNWNGALTLNEVTLTGNSVIGSPGTADTGGNGEGVGGGGLYSFLGSNTILNSVISNNSVVGGVGSAGVAGFSGGAGGNGGYAGGGGIGTYAGSLTINNSQIVGNTATGGAGGQGGAGIPTFLDPGKAGQGGDGGLVQGGGVDLYGQTMLTVNNTLISGNQVAGRPRRQRRLRHHSHRRHRHQRRKWRKWRRWRCRRKRRRRYGGAVFGSSSVIAVLSDSQVTGNKAIGGAGGQGGNGGAGSDGFTGAAATSGECPQRRRRHRRQRRQRRIRRLRWSGRRRRLVPQPKRLDHSQLVANLLQFGHWGPGRQGWQGRRRRGRRRWRRGHTLNSRDVRPVECRPGGRRRQGRQRRR